MVRHAAFNGKAVGDGIWYRGGRWVITKIGRKWVTAKNELSGSVWRFDIKTAKEEFIKTPCYATKEEMREAAK